MGKKRKQNLSTLNNFVTPCLRCLDAEADLTLDRYVCAPCNDFLNVVHGKLRLLHSQYKAAKTKKERDDTLRDIMPFLNQKTTTTAAIRMRHILRQCSYGPVYRAPAELADFYGLPKPKPMAPASMLNEAAKAIKVRSQTVEHKAKDPAGPRSTRHAPKLLHDTLKVVAIREKNGPPKEDIERILKESGVKPPVKEDLTQQELARKELAERELARRKLLRFVLRMYPKYLAGWFHIDLCERLERFYQAIVDGKSPRLMLSVPPRHGKSFLVSEMGPAWFLGRNPTMQIIASTYGQDLSNGFSGKVQELINNEAFAAVFPECRLAQGRTALESWATSKSGQYHSIGVGGPATGRGAYCLNIDDPIKNREDADSAAIRAKLYNWYTSTAYTRLMPGGGVLLTQTRWHDDDLMGRLEAEYLEAAKQAQETGAWPDDADQWEIVRYPAIAVEDEKFRKAGEALHPERYSLSALNRIKRAVGPRDWASLYQQTPVPEEGGYFKKDSIRYVEQLPPVENLKIYAASDLAISKKTQADFTVIAVVGIDDNDNMYVLDMRRGRWDADEIVDQFFDVHRTWHPVEFGVEDGAIAMALGPLLDRRIQEERLYDLHIKPLPTKGRDKEARARPFQGRMKQGKVLWQASAPWVPVLENELLRFPSGVHDDCVDALAHIGQMAMEIPVKQQSAPIRHKSWRDKLAEAEAAQGSGPRGWMRA
jgi:predicted phage terminase large subunit-like protein